MNAPQAVNYPMVNYNDATRQDYPFGFPQVGEYVSTVQHKGGRATTVSFYSRRGADFPMVVESRRGLGAKTSLNQVTYQRVQNSETGATQYELLTDPQTGRVLQQVFYSGENAGDPKVVVRYTDMPKVGGMGVAVCQTLVSSESGITDVPLVKEVVAPQDAATKKAKMVANVDSLMLNLPEAQREFFLSRMEMMEKTQCTKPVTPPQKAAPVAWKADYNG